MKVAIITPHYYPLMRGNAVTVRRIEKNLLRSGVDVVVYSLDAMSSTDIVREAAAPPPDLVHAFHGYSGGTVAALLRTQLGIPYVITLTGTDVYEALYDDRREATLSALQGAAGLAVFDESLRQRLVQHCAALAEKIAVVPQGLDLPAEVCPGTREFPFSPGTFTFLLPAGLRPVKNVLYALGPLAALHDRHPQLRFILAGPVLDPAYGARVMETLEGYHFAHYIGGIGHESMGCLYNKADVVLNTSRAEGGMANSILEALAYGKAVLAADIEGNRSLIADGKTGFLYGNEREFLAKAEALLMSPETRLAVGTAGQSLVRENFPPGKETAAYLQLYRAVKGEM